MAVQLKRPRDRTRLHSEGSDMDNEPLDPCECCTCEFARRMLNNITVFRATNTQHIRSSASSGNVSSGHSNSESSGTTQEMLQRSQGKNESRREKHNSKNVPADAPQKNFFIKNNSAPPENMMSKEPQNKQPLGDRQSQSPPPEAVRTESLAERCQAIVNKLEAQIATDMDALFKCCQRNNIQLPAAQQATCNCPVLSNAASCDSPKHGPMPPPQHRQMPPQQMQDPRANLPPPSHCLACPHHAACQNQVCYPCAVMSNVCSHFAPPSKDPSLEANASPEGAASSATGESRNDSLGDVPRSSDKEEKPQESRGPQCLYSGPCDPQANFQCRCWYCHQKDKGPDYDCKILKQEGICKIVPNRPSSVPQQCSRKKRSYETYHQNVLNRSGPRWDPSSRWDVEHKRPMGMDMKTKRAESKGLLSELCAPCPPPPLLPPCLPQGFCPQHGLRGRTRSADTDDRRNPDCKKSRTHTEQSAGDCIEHQPLYIPSSCRGSSSQGGVSESLATSFTESKYHSAMDVTESFDDECSSSRLDKCANFTNSKLLPEVKDSLELKRTAIRRIAPRERVRFRERNFNDNGSDASYFPNRAGVEKPKPKVTFGKTRFDGDKEHYASMANIRSLIDESDVCGCAKLFRASLHRLRNLSLLPCYHCADTCNILHFHQCPGKALRYPFMPTEIARVKKSMSGRELRTTYQTYHVSEVKKPHSPKRYERQCMVTEAAKVNKSTSKKWNSHCPREEALVKPSTSCEKSSFSDLEVLQRSVTYNNSLTNNKPKSYGSNPEAYNPFVKKRSSPEPYHASSFKSAMGNMGKIEQLKRGCDNLSEASNQWHSTCESIHPCDVPSRDCKNPLSAQDCLYTHPDRRSCQKCSDVAREYCTPCSQNKGKSSKEKQQIMSKLNTATKTINELLSSVNILSSSSKKQSLVKSCMNIPEEVIKSAWDEIIKKTVEKIEGSGPDFDENAASHLCGKLIGCPSAGHTSVLAYAPGKDDPSDNQYFSQSSSRNYDNSFEKFTPSWDKSKRPCNATDMHAVHPTLGKKDEMEKTGFLLDQITHRIAAIKDESGTAGLPRRLRGGCEEHHGVQTAASNHITSRELDKTDDPPEQQGKNDDSCFNNRKYHPTPHMSRAISQLRACTNCCRAHSADAERYIMREAEKGGAGDEHPAISRALGYPAACNYNQQSLLKLNQRLRSAGQCDESRTLADSASLLQHVELAKSQRKRKSAVVV